MSCSGRSLAYDQPPSVPALLSGSPLPKMPGKKVNRIRKSIRFPASFQKDTQLSNKSHGLPWECIFFRPVQRYPLCTGLPVQCISLPGRTKLSERPTPLSALPPLSSSGRDPGRFPEGIRKNLPDRPARKRVPVFSCILHKGREC